MRRRVVVVAERNLTRQLARISLTARGLLVVAEAATVDEALIVAQANRPDLMITFVDTEDAQAESRTVRLVQSDIRVLVVASDSAPDVAKEILASGAAGYITSQATADEVATAALAVCSGALPIDPTCAASVISEWRLQREMRPTEGDRSRHPEVIAGRPLEVLRLLADGLSTREVAEELGISIKTVESYKTQLFRSLGVRSRAQAVAVALSSGLLRSSAVDRTARR